MDFVSRARNAPGTDLCFGLGTGKIKVLQVTQDEALAIAALVEEGRANRTAMEAAEYVDDLDMISWGAFDDALDTLAQKEETDGP